MPAYPILLVVGLAAITAGAVGLWGPWVGCLVGGVLLVVLGVAGQAETLRQTPETTPAGERR